jgi:hypothetical protein
MVDEPGNRWRMDVNQIRNTPPPRQHVQYLADGAAARALALLHSCLNDEQRDMLRVHRKFRVVSNLGNIFEIREGRMHNIYKLDMAGNPIENWCVLPQGELAQGDAMLAQKLWLETDEAETERCANVTHIASGRLVRSAPVQYRPGIFVPELALN